MADLDSKTTDPEDEIKESLQDDCSGGGLQTTSSDLRRALAQSLGLRELLRSGDPPDHVLDDVTFDGVMECIKNGKCKKIIVMTGAGISTSAGIPDFRSPGTGLYDNLEKYDLPHPQAVFQIDYFRENPRPFYDLAKSLLPGVFKPTACHYFIKLLNEKGLLLRTYTQNVDALEMVAGIPEHKVIQAHGSFYTSRCMDCGEKYSFEWLKEKVHDGELPICTEDNCDGIIKPDIVFFGEGLPQKFFKTAQEDFPQCDLLIVMGTSLAVQPFASLVSRVGEECPRLYANLEKCALQTSDPLMAMLLGTGTDFNFDGDDNYRDVFWQGTCDDGGQAIADALGWGDELKKVVKDGHEAIDGK